MKRMALAMLGFMFVNPALAETSESLRASKYYSVLAGVGYRGPEYPEFSLYGHFMLDAASLVNVSLSSISGSIHEEATNTVDGQKLFYVGVTTEVRGSALAVSYRRFFTNSFYVDVGMDYEKASGEFKISKDVLATEEDLTADVGSYQKFSGMMEVGNQWQWDSFTLGASWVGVLVPLAQSYDWRLDEFTDGTPKSVKKFQTGATELQAALIRCYAGWSF